MSDAELKTNYRWPFKIGLFLVLLVWFGFTLVRFGRSLLTGVDVPYTDIPGAIGLSFWNAIGFTAIITVLFYLVRRGPSRVEVVNTFRWLVLFQAGYYMLFLPSAIWGLQYSSVLYSQEFFIIEAGLPCLVEAIVMPTVLVVLFLKLRAGGNVEEAIKWGLIAAASNIFVLWFNYTAQWWSDIYLHGLSFLTHSYLYTFEFVITVGGLLLLAIYASVYASKYAGAQKLENIDLRRGGIILTALGLYFIALLVLWLLFGDASFGKLTVWPTFSVIHNADIWMASLPLIGVPLIFSRKKK